MVGYDERLESVGESSSEACGREQVQFRSSSCINYGLIEFAKRGCSVVHTYISFCKGDTVSNYNLVSKAEPS